MTVVSEVKSSWADEVEETTGDTSSGPPALPPPTQVIDNGHKIITEFKYDENDKKVKVVRTYKVERRVVSKSIAMRKTWPKYGLAKNDKPGPNPANTIISEDIFMQFITSREEQDKPEEDALDKLKSMAEKTVKCRTCNGDHWTLKCPYKDTIMKNLMDERKTTVSGGSGISQQPEDKSKPSKYVPPSMREGAVKRVDTMRRDDNMHAIRIANLSESTQDQDLEDLVRSFGPYIKIFLAKDKTNGTCKGFAYVHFKNKADAARAIQHLNGYGYDHLILSVDWSTSKPPSL